ncbi:MAG: hypothetical protein KA085_09900 [Phenylobacterium sp.]|uniref:hypothetical protein n=1 Tax=Phenylobacterium sp. TaxID=1871053 RepID=UPI001B7CA2E6|nr:hypothetical protein [Phenylobacterium sp.]MBP7650143.1 hypothetical protein [Phenylobacterium sp.]MBP7816427.1 hypothetical protein [Phenylobacterium sp.]MBP9230349.1 hypothetical protein [Phenylobacterium sp.]
MWSMPRSVLRVVAVIIGLCAVSGFVLGVRGAPEKARLPGEGAPGAAAGVQLQATEAKPLDDTALAPPPPVVVEKAEEEKKPEEKKAAADPLDLAADQAPPVAVATVTPAKPAPPRPVTPPVAEDRVGDLLDGIIPADEPPH